MIKTHLFHKEIMKAVFRWNGKYKLKKDLLQIEYSFESKYFIGHKTFSDYWNLGRFNKRSQNVIKNNKTFRSVITKNSGT